MNSAEKATVKAHLDAEAQCLKDLEQSYKKAKKDCQDAIRALNARKKLNDPNLASVVHQKKYQEALLKQIDGVLNTLQTNTFTTADEFFRGSYQDGYIGSMYEMHHAGIPLVIPISPQRMQRAIQTDSKLSDKYYLKKGLSVTNIKTLKKKIASEVTSLIASGQSWLQASESMRVQRSFTIAQSDSMRIVRTEGNRINQQARLDAGDDAVKAGCDLVKIWDATLDSRTRPAHAEADGQIVEWGEDFTVMGEQLPCPGVHGSASNVINCRCQLLKKPKWALDEDELEELKKRAEFFGLDKSKDFEEFKEKYLKLPDDADTTPVPGVLGVPSDLLKDKVQLDISQFPRQFSQTKPEIKNTRAFIDYINNLDGVYDPNVVELFSNMGKMNWLNSKSVPFDITHSVNHKVQYAYRWDGRYAEVKLVVPKVTDGDIGSICTTLHEEMHFMDLLAGGENTHDGWFSANQTDLVNAFKNDDGSMGSEISDLFKRFHEECDRIDNEEETAYKQKLSELDAVHPFKTLRSFSDYSDYRKKKDKLFKEYRSAVDKGCRSALGGGLPALEDIYDALSRGERRDKGVVRYGHGSKYYKRDDSSAVEEALANYSDLSVTRPDLMQMLKKDKPEVVEQLGKCVEGMLKKVKS